QQTGELNGYFGLQRRGWSSSFDGGAATLRFAVAALTGNQPGLAPRPVWLSLVALVLLVLCVRQRLPWPLVAFAAAVLVLTLGSDGLMYSKVRLMLPAFPLLLPAAMGLARCRRATAVEVTSFVVFFGAWFGAYSLTAW